MLGDLPQDVYLVKILSFNFATVPLISLQMAHFFPKGRCPEE